ncbi:MAG: metallophosphoesterase [Phycisphaerales bacterium]|nr:MAG: metallophosphoesterase [Phycisphaerales bacterium]
MITKRLAWLICLTVTVLGASSTAEQRLPRRKAGAQSERSSGITHILGRPTDRSIAVSVLASGDIESYVEYGVSPGEYTLKTQPQESGAGQPFEIEIGGLRPDTRYYYRLRSRQPGTTDYLKGSEYSFHSQRPPGSTFVFAIQGDSHPERYGKMYDPDLYMITMNNVTKDRPDFYITLGDDFSIDRLINRNTLSESNVDQVYAYQRTFLGIVGRSSPLFLVNGNHEQAARHFLDGTPSNPAVLAGRARTRFYPLPAPGAFYSGDSEQVDFVGLLRDYYAWTWGDALFVVMDPYWHSTAPVDSAVGSGRRRRDSRGTRQRRDSGGRSRDWWKMSIGDVQYQWFRKTLEQSKARYKFVFAHHVLGTGRGGVEMAHLYEWGGRSRDGSWEFGEKRTGWTLPIHQLMAKSGVTIFFQGHDHLFARQERDGVVYQATPNPADASYQAFNREAYRSGDTLPNSGHLRVTVSPQSVRVDYIRSYLRKDETPEHKNGELAFSYSVGAAAPAMR